MARSYVSAGVFTKEIDVSFLGPGVGAIGAALLGTAAKGPAFTPVVVSDFAEFASVFGDLDPNHMLTYAARAYLTNSGVANIVRVLGPAGRSFNGTTVTPGYTADSVQAIVAASGTTTGAVMALLEITGAADFIINDLTGDEFDVRISSSAGADTFTDVFVTASFAKNSANYIETVLNTDPTKFTEKGYYLRSVYNYASASFADANATYGSASYALTNFATGFNSGSTPWITSQLFGGATIYDMFRIHTLGHGEAENGRFKISLRNIKTAVNPSVNPYGKFDLEVRAFDDTDKNRNLLETYPNLTLDPEDPSYILRVIGDKFWQFDAARTKMVEHGDYAGTGGSKLIRIEMTTGSLPGAALPWGFRGLAKPSLMILSGTGTGDFGLETSVSDGLLDIPYVADLKDKATQAEASTAYYWGMETILSGSVLGRLTYLPTMTGSDTDFNLRFVSGSTVGTLTYDTTVPVASQKQPGTTLGYTVLTDAEAKFTVPVAFGFDGFDRRNTDPLEETLINAGSLLGAQALRQAVDIIGDPDFIDINLLAIPGIYDSTVVDYAIDAVADRSDAFYVADITGSTVTAVTQEVKGRGLDTNYAGIYYPAINVYDDVNGRSVTVPASIPAIGAIAFTDRVSAPWWAPAGLNRGGLSRDTIGFNVLSMKDQLTAAERNSLYENRINPIARFPDVPQGVVWGQKTLQLKSSALDRVNVRRLLIRAKKLIASAVKYLVFEPNDATTQTQFRQLVNPILADIQQKQGLEKFLVVCDASNNPPELVNRNIMAGQILLVPIKSAEFIDVSFVVSPTGASFDEA